MTTIKEALQRSAEHALTEAEVTPLTDELRAICERIQAECGATAVAVIVAGERDELGRAHVFDASTVDFMPLSLFYGIIAGSHMEQEQRVKTGENVTMAHARRNGIH